MSPSLSPDSLLISLGTNDFNFMMITQGKEKKKNGTCTEELEEKRNSSGDMATLCTEIGMPKYRENKKKWKSFLPGNIPANICHRQCLVCVKVSVCAIQYVPSACMAVYSLLNVQEYIFMLCESVYICVQIQRECVFMRCHLNVCGSMHSHTRVLMFLYVHPKPALLISCTFCVCVRMKECVRPKCFHAYIQSFLIYPIFVGVCRVCTCGRACVCVSVCVCAPACH